MFQTMETAPKDGRDILLLSWNHGQAEPQVAVVCWCDKHGHEGGDYPGVPICNPRWCVHSHDKSQCFHYFNPSFSKYLWCEVPKNPWEHKCAECGAGAYYYRTEQWVCEEHQ